MFFVAPLRMAHVRLRSRWRSTSERSSASQSIAARLLDDYPAGIAEDLLNEWPYTGATLVLNLIYLAVKSAGKLACKEQRLIYAAAITQFAAHMGVARHARPLNEAFHGLSSGEAVWVQASVPKLADGKQAWVVGEIELGGAGPRSPRRLRWKRMWKRTMDRMRQYVSRALWLASDWLCPRRDMGAWLAILILYSCHWFGIELQDAGSHWDFWFLGPSHALAQDFAAKNPLAPEAA